MTYELKLTPAEAKAAIKEYFGREGAKLSRSVSCRYRHPDDGRACAVGCLIPDEEYKEAWEGSSVTHLAGDGHLAASDGLIVFLQSAQRAHDRARTVEEFLERLEELPA